MSGSAESALAVAALASNLSISLTNRGYGILEPTKSDDVYNYSKDLVSVAEARHRASSEEFVPRKESDATASASSRNYIPLSCCQSQVNIRGCIHVIYMDYFCPCCFQKEIKCGPISKCKYFEAGRKLK